MGWRILGFVTFLACASTALGDGCYIPARAVRKIPEIPAQRAVLVWKDGVETLVIASALDSEAQNLGWIIPVPDVPRTLEKETPGALKTLDFCIQPQIFHDLYPLLRSTVLVLFLANLLVATWLFKRERLFALLYLLMVLFLLSGLLLPAAAGSRTAAKAAKLQVGESTRVGSYDVSVLKPSRSEELNIWLVENGFASLPDAAEETIADYIAREWRFAAIKLTRGESGANTPHPIRITFAAEQPVYPMKLTAIAGGNVDLGLFVIADEKAACGALDEEFCDRFFVSKMYGGGHEYEYEAKTRFSGENTGRNIGHPSIQNLMWDGCILTKFAGTMSTSDMTTDIQFNWVPFHASQQRFFTRRGAGELRLALFVFVVGTWGIVSMRKYRDRIVQPRGLRWYLGKKALPVIALSAVGAGILYACLPKLDDADLQISSALGHRPLFLRYEIEAALENHPEVVHGTEEEIAEHILENLRKNDEDGARKRRNGVMGTDLKVEDSPGNFTVEKQREGKISVRIYEEDGSVVLVEHPKSGRGGHKATRSAAGGVGAPLTATGATE